MGHPPNMEMPKSPVPGVKYLITVGSGKGGVGKTTVAVNLALALKALGNNVGLLDADVYGPNVPRMMGVNEPPRANGDRIRPIEKNGLKLMSMGFLNPGDKPVIWRGPMLHSVMNQFINNVEWGSLDYLIVDLPPGTGDVALSLAQSTAITGAIVVTTPSEVALEDARKAVMMFRQLHVELLGLVENMSYLIAPQSGERIDVFGEGGGRHTAVQMQIPLLAELPLVPEIRAGGDAGKPVALLGKDSPAAAPFFELAEHVIARTAEAAAHAGPTIAVED
ncbi:MAG: Mrp/NBP35 family ATP-binding protein [Bryobacterales bacterium]|nr:Mrp/NBP35 family ATP-binding protein [Bryobacterales bacterium]